MDARTSVVGIAILLALFTASATEQDKESSDLFDDTHTSSDYGPENEADYWGGGDDGGLLRSMISKLMRAGPSIGNSKGATRHGVLSATAVREKGEVTPPHIAAPRQLHYDVLGLSDGQVIAGDMVNPDYDKRGRCKGRNCRKVEGLNPNANYRPLPFGKRFWSSATSGTSSGKLSNKRGRAKGRLRVPLSRRDFLPFGRR